MTTSARYREYVCVYWQEEEEGYVNGVDTTAARSLVGTGSLKLVILRLRKNQ